MDSFYEDVTSSTSQSGELVESGSDNSPTDQDPPDYPTDEYISAKTYKHATIVYHEQLVDMSEVESRAERRKENLTELVDTLILDKMGCGTKPSSSKHHRHKRVVHGRQNIPNEWPWLVSLHFLPETNFTKRSGYKHVCGANLIAPDWLLCAAHCFSDYFFQGLSNLSDWEAYIGLHDQAFKDDVNVQIRNITMVIIHPDRNTTGNFFKADLSLIKLDRPVTMKSTISPICLDNTDVFYKDAMCYITGWGQRSFQNGTGTRMPYTASLSLMTVDDCKSRYDSLAKDKHEFFNVVYVDDPVICAYGYAGEDTCLGDSGGPLMCMADDGRWMLAGVVSGGYECAVELFPGFYTRVSYYYEWITNQITLYGD